MSLLERMADRIWPFTDAVDYETPIEDSVGHIAEREGRGAETQAEGHREYTRRKLPFHSCFSLMRGKWALQA